MIRHYQQFFTAWYVPKVLYHPLDGEMAEGALGALGGMGGSGTPLARLGNDQTPRPFISVFYPCRASLGISEGHVHTLYLRAFPCETRSSSLPFSLKF